MTAWQDIEKKTNMETSWSDAVCGCLKLQSVFWFEIEKMGFFVFFYYCSLNVYSLHSFLFVLDLSPFFCAERNQWFE